VINAEAVFFIRGFTQIFHGFSEGERWSASEAPHGVEMGARHGVDVVDIMDVVDGRGSVSSLDFRVGI